MLEYDFEESVTFWIFMTSHLVEQTLNDELARHGITYRQMQVLGWLSLEGELTQSQLAEKMRVEAPTLAGILERMERDLWIKRENDSEDRRRKIVRPTERVNPVWAKIVAAARMMRSRATAGIPAEDLEHLKATLQRIQQNLRAPVNRVEEAAEVLP